MKNRQKNIGLTQIAQRLNVACSPLEGNKGGGIIKYIGLFLITIVSVTPLSAQTQHKFLKKADSAYERGTYSTAEENYRKANEKSQNTNATYNLGNAIFKQDRLEEAVEKYQSAAEMTNDPQLKSNAFHNLGNAHYGLQQFDKSVEAYKNALRVNSKDLETKKNLAMAQRQLRIQQQQQQQQENKENEDQENKEDQEQQKQQEQQQEQQENEEEKKDEEQEQEQQQDQEQEGKEEEEKEQQQPQDLSKQEAEKLLQIIEQEEQKVQEKLRRKQSQPNKSDKDW